MRPEELRRQFDVVWDGVHRRCDADLLDRSLRIGAKRLGAIPERWKDTGARARIWGRLRETPDRWWGWAELLAVSGVSGSTLWTVLRRGIQAGLVLKEAGDVAIDWRGRTRLKSQRYRWRK